MRAFVWNVVISIWVAMGMALWSTWFVYLIGKPFSNTVWLVTFGVSMAFILNELINSEEYEGDTSV